MHRDRGPGADAGGFADGRLQFLARVFVEQEQDAVVLALVAPRVSSTLVPAPQLPFLVQGDLHRRCSFHRRCGDRCLSLPDQGADQSGCGLAPTGPESRCVLGAGAFAFGHQVHSTVYDRGASPDNCVVASPFLTREAAPSETIRCRLRGLSSWKLPSITEIPAPNPRIRYRTVCR